MEKASLPALLRGNTYPGRGIVLGLHADAKHLAVAYFIMGRSQNSRNRIFVPTQDGIMTKAYDERLMSDPSLIIYRPIRRISKDTLIVTNGDQTDTIVDFLAAGKSFEAALRTRTFEPDSPNWTPRISGLLHIDAEHPAYRLSILKSADPFGCAEQRFFYEYPSLIAGEGHFIHTYQHDGSPIPSFQGEPLCIGIDGNIDAWADAIWQALDAENKVSLYVSLIDIRTGEAESRIINKLGK